MKRILTKRCLREIRYVKRPASRNWASFMCYQIAPPFPWTQKRMYNCHFELDRAHDHHRSLAYTIWISYSNPVATLMKSICMKSWWRLIFMRLYDPTSWAAVLSCWSPSARFDQVSRLLTPTSNLSYIKHFAVSSTSTPPMSFTVISNPVTYLSMPTASSRSAILVWQEVIPQVVVLLSLRAIRDTWRSMSPLDGTELPRSCWASRTMWALGYRSVWSRYLFSLAK